MALDPQAKSFVANKFGTTPQQIDSLSAIPGFNSELERGFEVFKDGMTGGGGRYVSGGLGIMSNAIKGATADPIAFVKSAMRYSVYNGQTDVLKQEIAYLQQNNIPVEDIKSLYTSYATQKADADAAYAAAQQGGRGLFGDVGKFFASIDPSTAISKAATDLFSPVAQAATDLFQPVEKAITAGVADVSKALSTDDAKKAMAVGAAFFIPGVGAAIGQSLVTAGVITGSAIPYAAAIGTALASTAAQTAQGVPLDQALGNSVTSAVVSTGAPSVAQDINALVKSPAVADAITSAGASALKTAIAGGSAEDIQRNMTAALAGSSASSLYSQAAEAETAATGRIIGAAVGGGIAGGTMGAVTGVAGELGRPETTPTRPPQLAEADTGTVSDVPTLTEILVTAPREALDIGDTSIISPDISISPIDRAVIDAAGITEAPSLPQVTVTATPESPAIEDTSIITPDTSISPQDKAIINTTGIGDEPSLKEVTVTARPEAPEIEDTSIIDPVSVTDESPEKDVVAEEEPAEEEPAEEESVSKEEPYKPDLFVYGGKTPKTRPRTRTDLGTTLQGPFAPSTTLGQALTGYRGAGEIEGKKSGKPRQNVWNEESLRLKDALGL